MSRYDQHIEINVLDRATEALDRIIAKAKELHEQDTTVDIDAGSGFYETQEQIRNTRAELDKLREAYDTLSTKSSKVSSSRSLKKYTEEAKTLKNEITKVYREINLESVNESVGDALLRDSRRLQKSLSQRLESAKATEKENKALRQQAQEIQRVNSAYQEFYATVSRVKALSSGGANGAYSYNAFNADGTPASTNVAGLLGAATNFTMHGTPYDPTTERGMVVYSANPYARRSYTYSYGYGGRPDYGKNPVIYVDPNGNVTNNPYVSPILSLPAGSAPTEPLDFTDYSSLSEVRGGFGSNLGVGAQKSKGLFESVLGTSLGKYITRLSMYQMVSGAIYGTVQAFKDALGTMKEVDSELASIQKVTDFDAEQMKSIEESAYDVASQYGVSAQEYLESVSAFAKAGYKNLADDLGELAIKTQLVGDVTASTANQFLLSVDAAWKMNGSVEDLSKVLDEANVVENNYATSIDKLAQGMPNVASVASMAGMSAEQTIAALGTITAVTQQSGTKAATALRALILNIMKDTTTEVEEGVTVTKEQITSLEDVLHTYAQEALDAASATGEIVNPMEVVAALAKAYKENRITDQDLAKIEMSLGGKLRTNQLDALLKNFDTTYQGMMDKMATAAGSANKEIGVMLDTWEAKSNILQNTWTKFIADTLDTRLFKNILDFATDALNSVGNLQNAFVALGGTITSIMLIVKPEKFTSLFNNISKGISSLLSGKGGAFGLGIAGAVATVGYIAYTKWKQGIDEAAEESEQTAKESSQKSIEVLQLVSAYESAREGSLAFKEASTQLAAALGLEGNAVDSLKDKYKDLVYGEGGVLSKASTDATQALLAAEKALDTEFNTTNYSVRRNGGRLAKQYGDINGIIDTNLEQFWNQREGRYDSGFSREGRLAYYDAVKKTLEEVNAAASKLSLTEQKEIFGSAKYKDLLRASTELSDYVDNYRNRQVDADVAKRIADGTINSIQAFEVYRETLKRTIDDEETLQATLEVLDSAFPQFASKVADTTNALNGNAGAANEATNALERYKKALSEGGEKNDKFNDIIDAAQKMAEAGEKGYFGSNAFQEGAKLAFGKDYASSHSGEEIVNHYKELQKMGVFDKDSMGRGLKNLITSSDAKEVEGNLTRIRDAAGEVIAEISDNGDGTFGFDITNTEAGLGELERILGVSKEHIIAMQEAMGMFDASINTENLENQFNNIFEKEEELAKPVDVPVTANTRAAIEGLSAVEAKRNALDGSSADVTVNIHTNGSFPSGFSGGGGGATFGGGGSGGNGGRASGDKNFKGGLVLVNEQAGGFNPELIEVGDKSFFVNGGRPALVSLPKGAIIHNATETRKLFAKDYMEVPHYETGTRIPVGDIARRSGKVAGIGNGKGSASSGDWWEKLQQYMEDLLEKAGDALDKQLEAIDAELFYLQYGKEVSEKATKLEEARMDLLEAEQELINAQTERTVRYFNAETGQWEWMADQKDILKAQEDLAEKQKDYLQAQYDYLEDVWSELKDDIQKAIDGKKDVNIENVLRQMMNSKAGGLAGNVEGVIGDLLNLITALSNGTALDSYDSGGIANGLGYMYKATKADEVVLNGKLSNAILSPKRSQQFADFTSSLERMFGMSAMMDKPQSRMGFSTTDYHGTNITINGMKVGSDMLNRPLSEVLSVLPIYCN